MGEAIDELKMMFSPTGIRGSRYLGVFVGQMADFNVYVRRALRYSALL